MEPAKKKAICYIDGFNLYFGLKSANLKRYYWLNLEKLCSKIVEPQPDEELVHIKYFTAKVKQPLDKAQRQDLFLQALQTLSTLEIIYGRYSSYKKDCPHKIRCHSCSYFLYDTEEKKTDVEISVNMVCDAFKNAYDVAYMISGDSDLSPAAREIKALFPEKKIIVCFPPNRKSKELVRLCDGKRKIIDYLSGCEFPDIMQNRIGVTINKPSSWV